MDSNEELVGRVASLEARVAALEGGGGSVAALQHSSPQPETGAISVHVSNLRHHTSDYGQQHVWFDCTFKADHLPRPTRAIKGALEFCDLFGEPRLVLGYVLNEHLRPSQALTVQGIGFEYNQFMADHQWLTATRPEDMLTRFRVDQVLYDD